jgi:tellurite resistance protein TehA-like permease
MKKNNSKYFLLIAVVAVIGMISTMVHYHGEKMECLEHAHDSHVVEYDVYCPISTLVSDADFIEPQVIEAFISFESKIFYTNDHILKSYISTKLGRSPPAIA